MNDMLSQIEEIQSNVREIKATWGNTVMMLDNIKSALKADRQKAIDDAYDRGYKECFSEHKFDVPCSICDDYERGLNDAWDAARKIVCCDGLTVQEIHNIFNCTTAGNVLRRFSASEAIAKTKAHEAEKDEIRVGDEVRRISDGVKYVVVEPKNEFDRACGFSMNGIWYGERPDAIRKTGRRFDIESILKEMQS